MMINLKEYPLMSGTPLILKPMAVFRIEGVPFSVNTPAHTPQGPESVGENRNALLMFTGLLTTNSEDGIDYLHCVPLMFYHHREGPMDTVGCPEPFGVWLEILYTDTYTRDAYSYSHLTTPGAFN